MFIGSASYKLSRLKALVGILKGNIAYIGLDLFGLTKRAKYCDIFIGWGYGHYAKKNQIIAQQYQKPFLFIEDGFLRSPFVSSLSKEPYSLVIDSKAPYYDAYNASDLEDLINKTRLSDFQTQQAKTAIDYFVKHKLGKFAIINDISNPVLPKGFTENSVLLIDQVAGDLSLEYGGVNDSIAQQAFDSIRQAYPDTVIYLKLHPEVLAGKKQGCFDFAHNQKNVVCISDIDLMSLLTVKPRLFVLTSLAGFEAVLHGCSVTVFGLPWYAGYGLTDDRHTDISLLKQRRKKTDLRTVFYCAYMVYSHYVNPITQTKMNFFDVMQFFARIKKHIQMMHGHIIAVGIRPWKKRDFYPWIKTYFNKVTFCDDYHKIANIIHNNLNTEFKILVWNYKNQSLINTITNEYPHIKIIRVEDGFIRSYGLGSDFFPPLSLCFDNNHLYFYHTETKKSDFHTIINKGKPSVFLLERAEKLQQLIINNNISKYNLESVTPLNIKTDKMIIFVAGQVFGDASLRFGGLPDTLKSDYDLLKQIRHDYPNAYILYKPHPDVTHGNRKNAVNFDKCDEFYDHIEKNASVIACMNASDIVAVLTSQTGLDALIRGEKVICYGEAFYKNHGLCLNDTVLLNNNKIDLNHLIYAALIEYPLYKNGKDYITPEMAIAIILQQKSFWNNPIRYFLVKFRFLIYVYKIKKWILG